MIVIACGSVAAVVAAGVFSLRARNSSVSTVKPSLDLFESAARYRPMVRLLDGPDFKLLTEAGDPRLLRKIRSQRRDIFRSYLRSLRRDQSMVCAQIREMMAYSKDDCKDLSAALLRMELTFQTLMAGIEVKLMLHYAGFGTVRVAPLVQCFESLCSQAKLLATPARALAA